MHKLLVSNLSSRSFLKLVSPKLLSVDTTCLTHVQPIHHSATAGEGVTKPKSVWKMPGIPILPLVGSWPFLWINKEWNIYKLQKFYRSCYEKYGPIFRLRHPGGGNQVFIYDAKDVKKLFFNSSVAKQPHRAHFDALIQIRSKELSAIFRDAGMTFSSGEEWQRVRSIFNTWLLREDLTMEAKLCDEVALEFIDRIKLIRDPRSSEVPRHFMNEITSFTTEAMTNALLGLRTRRLVEDLPHNSPMKSVIDNGLKSVEALENTEFKPQLWRLYETGSYKDMQKYTNETLRYVHSLLDTRLKQLKDNPSSKKDTIFEKATNHPDLLVGDVYSTIHDLLGAGLEVTPQSASKVLYCLAKFPDAQKKLRQEVDAAIMSAEPFDKAVTGGDVPYLKGFIRETLRYMPTAISTNRVLPEPVIIGNYKIPKGWSVTVPLMSLGLEENNVQRSQEFIPERFVGRDNPLRPSTYGYLPFSFGLRQCIGRHVAEIILRIFAARIVQNFEVSYDHGDLDQVSRIVLRLDGPLNFTLKDRKKN